uniref:non-specific serine/threonine protein kinase n=1 Tax=Chenopodium quinoa TaxID=63459 RepID=A0A803MD94_CHEQI
MLSGEIPNSISSCVALEYLYLAKNKFHGAIPDALRSLKGLVELDLSYNNLSGPIPQFLESLQLQLLNISHNNLEGKVPIGGVFSNVTNVLVDNNSRTCGGIPELKLPRCTIFNLEYRGASKSFIAECEVLRSIRRRNLLKVITACSSVDHQGKEFKALVYEYMVNGSLENWLHLSQAIDKVESTCKTSRTLNFRQRLDIAVDVALSLDYLHHQCGAPIVHCDLKPSNILLDDDLVANVGDFGLAKILLEGINSSHANQYSSVGVRGTIGYTPPEYGVGNEVSTIGDVYSFGILFLEMFTGMRPTNDMFKVGLSLQSFVKNAIPEEIDTIVDHTLIEDIDRERHQQECDVGGLNFCACCSTFLLS